MSNEQEKINRWFKKHRWNHQTFFNRPHWTRRHFLELMGAGRHRHRSWRSVRRRRPMWPPPAATTKDTAQNVIFILLAGAPSHTDTFDLKDASVSTTPAGLHKPEHHQRHLVPDRA